jgi:hypothetical protein
MYKIIIPSYKRDDIIFSHTLKCIKESDLKDREIFVFVADAAEFAIYDKKLKPLGITVVQGVRGIPNQRNFIQKFFPEGEHLLFIDDDIKRIIGLNKDGKRVVATRLDGFIKKAFEITEKLNLRMFGINSTNSNLEMKQTVSVGLIYLVGNFYGLINTHSVLVDEGEKIKARKDYRAGKESHERALLMFKRYGGVAKFRSFGVISEYWGVKGGHQVSRNAEGEKEATLVLHRMYPDITKVRVYKDVFDLTIPAKTKVFNIQFTQ